MIQIYHLRRDDFVFYVNDQLWSNDVNLAASHTIEEWKLIVANFPHNHFDETPNTFDLIETFESLHERASEELNEGSHPTIS